MPKARELRRSSARWWWWWWRCVWCLSYINRHINTVAIHTHTLAQYNKLLAAVRRARNTLKVTKQQHGDGSNWKRGGWEVWRKTLRVFSIQTNCRVRDLKAKIDWCYFALFHTFLPAFPLLLSLLLGALFFFFFCKFYAWHVVGQKTWL